MSYTFLWQSFLPRLIVKHLLYILFGRKTKRGAFYRRPTSKPTHRYIPFLLISGKHLPPFPSPFSAPFLDFNKTGYLIVITYVYLNINVYRTIGNVALFSKRKSAVADVIDSRAPKFYLFFFFPTSDLHTNGRSQGARIRFLCRCIFITFRVPLLWHGATQ